MHEQKLRTSLVYIRAGLRKRRDKGTRVKIMSCTHVSIHVSISCCLGLPVPGLNPHVLWSSHKRY